MSTPVAHILYVITDLELGGVPLHLARLASAMRGRSYRVSVVSLAPPGPVGERLIAQGIDVLSCEALGGWDVRVIGRLTRILSRVRPDIVHALLFHANLAARLAVRFAGIPPERLLCEIQTVEVERRWHLWVDRFAWPYGRLTIGNSPSVVAHLADEAGIPASNLRLIRGGVDVAAIRGARAIERAALGVPDGVGLILWVGRMDPVKGLDYLVESFAGVHRDTGAHLVLVGGGPEEGRIRALANLMVPSGAIHLTGPRGDVPAILGAADLFVFPSRTEGLPNALLEAMAAGCPIVTTDVAGCRDLISHEVTGLLVPHGDTVALAAAMGRLLVDREAAMRLGGAAAREGAERWSIESTMAGYAALYAEVLAG